MLYKVPYAKPVVTVLIFCNTKSKNESDNHLGTLSPHVCIW